MTKKQKIFNWILKNPIDDSKPNKYEKLRKQFNLTVKQASAYWIECRNSYKIKNIPEANYSPTEIKKILKQEGDNLDVTVNVEFEVKSLQDLLTVCEVNEAEWKVISWQCKKWDLGIKNTEGSIETKELYSVSAKFAARKVETDLSLQKDVIMEELFKNAPKHDLINSYKYFSEEIGIRKQDANNLLEIALFDVHFGKLAHNEEVGEDYDLKIACERFKTAVKSLVGRVNIATVERILLPIGQDLINIDNLVGTTTKGTPQDTDSRFHKIVKTVKNVLIETINDLVALAPVDVVVTVGNHDEQTTFMIGEMLEAYYHNSLDVTVYNDATLRKYYQYGITSLMFTHGDKEKFNELGMIFAAENPKLWADTKQRYIQIGHFHHNKKVTTLQTQEFQGFQVQILPSLSGSDAWHKGKGFDSLKQAKAFLFNKEEGLIGEFSYTVH